jgi:hypothetical protein
VVLIVRELIVDRASLIGITHESTRITVSPTWNIILPHSENTHNIHKTSKHNGHREFQDERCVSPLVRSIAHLQPVLNEPLQPLTTSSDSSHPTGFFRDGYCWGSDQDPGKHFIGAVVTDKFLQYSKEKGQFD